MSMNVSTTTATYANYQNNYKTGTANKKKETAQTTENTKLKENTTESIAEKNLSKAAQKMLENLRGSRNDMDFMVADFENGDNAKDILAQSDKEYTVIFSKEEMEKMLGKRHDNLLRAIRKYITQLGDEAPKYFSEDPDKGGRLYHITKAGCDLMAGRIIGAQSEAFKTKYAPVFGEEAPVEVVEEKQEEPQEKAYTVEEVAQILGCSERNVYRNIQSGKLEAVEREVMIPTLKKFVTEEALEKYKAGRAS